MDLSFGRSPEERDCKKHSGISNHMQPTFNPGLDLTWTRWEFSLQGFPNIVTFFELIKYHFSIYKADSGTNRDGLLMTT